MDFLFYWSRTTVGPIKNRALPLHIFSIHKIRNGRRPYLRGASDKPLSIHPYLIFVESYLELKNLTAIYPLVSIRMLTLRHAHFVSVIKLLITNQR